MRFRPEIASVPESPLVQIATVAESMIGAIKLCYGESDLPTPEFICRAAHEAAMGGHTFYTHTAGYIELRETIAAKVYELHGMTYRASEIMSTVGASMAIYLAIRACVGPGDNAIIITPGYGIFANVVRMCGGDVRSVPLAASGNHFVLDIDRVRHSIDARTRMLIVNSPSNPTGWVASVDEQQILCKLAESHGIMLLADEVYDRLVFDEPIAPSFARFARDLDQLVIVNSFSKTFNMTGWRLGWAQASEPMIRIMTSAAEFMTSNPTALVQQAGIVALRNGDTYVRDLRRHYADRRAQVMRELPKVPGVTLVEPKGAFYAFMRIDDLTDSAAFAMRLLRESGIAVAPGSAFGEGGEGYIRMCFAATEETLTRALDRFREFMVRAQSV